MERSRPALPSGTKGGFMTLVPQPNSPDDTIVAPRRLAVRGAQPQPDPYDDLDRNRARLARRGVPADAPAPRDPQQRAGGPGPRRGGPVGTLGTGGGDRTPGRPHLHPVSRGAGPRGERGALWFLARLDRIVGRQHAERRAGVRIGASPRPQPQIAEHGAAEGAPVGGRATPRA